MKLFFAECRCIGALAGVSKRIPNLSPNHDTRCWTKLSEQKRRNDKDPPSVPPPPPAPPPRKSVLALMASLLTLAMRSSLKPSYEYSLAHTNKHTKTLKPDASAMYTYILTPHTHPRTHIHTHTHTDITMYINSSEEADTPSDPESEPAQTPHTSHTHTQTHFNALTLCVLRLHWANPRGGWWCQCSWMDTLRSHLSGGGGGSQNLHSVTRQISFGMSPLKTPLPSPYGHTHTTWNCDYLIYPPTPPLCSLCLSVSPSTKSLRTVHPFFSPRIWKFIFDNKKPDFQSAVYFLHRNT